ncbi:hypothetical protein ANN_01213 [Periplaneta americana]|uniref:Uncharacterized protein n=1 Tax=Periplaneta americana TaxID=6978 RepID=A0ABQ8TVU6_PERAM|nr:hypothetical protein ANN_01213 [Periplaneta americana]
MAGLCEGGNEPAGFLKAICNTWTRTYIDVGRRAVMKAVLLGVGRDVMVGVRRSTLEANARIGSIWGQNYDLKANVLTFTVA